METIKWFFWQFFIMTVAFFEWLFGARKPQPSNELIFWDRVHRCLMKFHGMSSEKAAKNVKRYLDEFQGDKKLIIYQDPLHVANDVAEFEVVLTADQYRQLYVKDILNE